MMSASSVAPDSVPSQPSPPRSRAADYQRNRPEGAHFGGGLSKPLGEMIATNATTHGLVAGGIGNLFALASVSRVSIQRQRVLLKLRRTELQLLPISPTAFILRERQHLSRNSLAAQAGSDVHAPQLHRMLA